MISVLFLYTPEYNIHVIECPKTLTQCLGSDGTVLRCCSLIKGFKGLEQERFYGVYMLVGI